MPKQERRSEISIQDLSIDELQAKIDELRNEDHDLEQDIGYTKKELEEGGDEPKAYVDKLKKSLETNQKKLEEVRNAMGECLRKEQELNGGQ